MFRTGQKVVCVDADGAPLELNAVYTINKVWGPTPVKWRGKLFESGYSVRLYEAKPAKGFWGFATERFRPLDDRKTDISIFTKMLMPKKSTVDV